MPIQRRCKRTTAGSFGLGKIRAFCNIRQSAVPIDMSFRKQNIGLSSSSSRSPTTPDSSIGSNEVAHAGTATKPLAPIPGVCLSPLNGGPTTSTSTPSTSTPTLNALLAGHAGLALGSSLLIEESGTTDFAGALLRYYAAEGVVQGHAVHVVGVGEQWGRELPGVVGTPEGEGQGESVRKEKAERMKIAWRYERLGNLGLELRG